MSLPPKPPPLSEALAYAARAREHLRAGLGDARRASFEPPPADEHARRFFFGLALPLTLMRVAWSNAETRRSIVTRLIPPLLLVGLVATVGVVDIAFKIAARNASSHSQSAAAAEDDDEDDEDEDAARPKHVSPEQARRAKETGERVKRAVDEARARGAGPIEVSKAAIEATQTAEAEAAEEARTEADEAPKAPPPPPPAAASSKGAIGASGATALRAIWRALTSKVAKLIATLSILEWILVWIGREHHDLIAWETAVLTGVPGEAPVAPPRLRFDLGWLKLKGWRAIRLLIFFALAVPMAWILGLVPFIGGTLGVALEAAWAAYWACAFAIANTSLVWEVPIDPEAAPWFIRGLRTMGAVPVIGVLFRLYARLAERLTRNVWPACLAFEKTPWESAGLALSRTIFSFPVVYIITRPAFTPAATHAWLARVGRPQAAPSESPIQEA